MTRVNIDIPEELHKKAKIICAVQGKTLRDYIIKSLETSTKKDKTNI